MLSVTQHRYRNGSDGGNSFDARYLQVWQSFLISDYDYGERSAGGDLEIADLAITAPAERATVAVPATFTWQGRNLAGETYQWFLDGVADFGACDQPSPTTDTSFTFTDLDCNFPSVPTDTPLAWSVAL